MRQWDIKYDLLSALVTGNRALLFLCMGGGGGGTETSYLMLTDLDQLKVGDSGHWEGLRVSFPDHEDDF